MKNYDIEEENDFDYETIQHKIECKCALCSEIYHKNDLKTICGVLICKECELSPDSLNEFTTIENAINWYKKRGYIK